jgi:hypothetical protein
MLMFDKQTNRHRGEYKLFSLSKTCLSSSYADYCSLVVVRRDKCFLPCRQLNLFDALTVGLSLWELCLYESNYGCLPFSQLKLYHLIMVALPFRRLKMCDVIAVNYHADC